MNVQKGGEEMKASSLVKLNSGVQCPDFFCGSYETVKIKEGFYHTYKCLKCGKEFLK